MIENKKICVIERAEFGIGGYQDAQFGFTLSFRSEAWGIETFEGFWFGEPRGEWDKDDQITFFGEAAKELHDALLAAKVSNVSDLVGVPAEVMVDGGRFKSWRVLTEVLL